MFVTITLIVEVSAYAGQCSVFVVSVSLFVRNSSLLDLFLATVLVNLHFCSTEFDFQFFWLYSRWFGTIGILARFDIPHFGIEFVYAELLLGLIYPAT